ncbi:MAG TPA: adenine deaminase C-terminal domain-containing protein [Desulfobacteraceae bacterium]|nr:adenine deaminase C-terminal domain-containing protein [Desulfobacteraceae bacterium]
MHREENGVGSDGFFAADRRRLMETALGKQAPDLVVENASLFNVYTGEIRRNSSIAVSSRRIACVGGKGDFPPGPETRVVDADHQTVIPGLIDGHTHLAWLATPCEFLGYAARGGTTTIVTETMEMYPAGGLEGVIEFLAALENQPVKILATAPAMASISRNALGISDSDLQQLLAREDIIGLGEAYWQTVLQNPDIFLAAYERTAEAKKSIEGHSAGARGRKLAAYTALGISSCHEPINRDQVLERLRNGIYTMAREGGVRSDLSEIAAITEQKVDLRRLCLVSDGITPEDLVSNGYMETILQKAIDQGFDPKDAVRMVTLNVAENFGLSGHIGGIAPGRYADMVIIPDMKNIQPSLVISSGRVIAENGVLSVPPRQHRWRPQARTSVHLPARVRASDFDVLLDRDNDHPPDNGRARVNVRVLELITDLVTKERVVAMDKKGKVLSRDRENDVLKVSAVDRRLSPGSLFSGFIKGFNLKKGAFAATGAWDTSNIVVVGENDRDMAFAVNRIKDLQGGVVVCSDETILAELPLPLFGLFSEDSIEAVAEKRKKINRTVRDLGAVSADPLLTLTTLTGAAIPYLRICEQGLVDVKTGGFLSFEYGRL